MPALERINDITLGLGRDSVLRQVERSVCIVRRTHLSRKISTTNSIVGFSNEAISHITKPRQPHDQWASFRSNETFSGIQRYQAVQDMSWIAICKQDVPQDFKLITNDRWWANPNSSIVQGSHQVDLMYGRTEGIPGGVETRKSGLPVLLLYYFVSCFPDLLLHCFSTVFSVISHWLSL